MSYNKSNNLACVVTNELEKHKGEFIRLMDFPVGHKGTNKWFALIMVSGKLERFNLDDYHIKILNQNS